MTVDATRLATGLILLLMVPVAAYIADRSAQLVGLSLVSVALVATSLYLMFGPAEEPDHGEHHG